jgi:hypothetical protein
MDESALRPCFQEVRSCSDFVTFLLAPAAGKV